MKYQNVYSAILDAVSLRKKLLAILVDPDKFDLDRVPEFLRNLPPRTTHIFVGGSSVPFGLT